MIADTLCNSGLYRGISPRIALAFDYLCGMNPLDRSDGTCEIDGTNVYAIHQEYETQPAEQGSWEAHRQYIDLQYIIAGTERIGFAHVNRLSPGIYIPERDLLPLSGEGDFLTFRPGDFMLLFPEDAHMPKIASGAPARVRKVVIKIAVAP